MRNIVKRSVVPTLILALACSLCGCLRLKIGAVVSEDGTVDVSILYASVAVDDEDTTTTNLLTDEQKQELESQGWTCEDYFGEDGDTQDYFGYLITKNVTLDNWNEELSGDLLPTSGLKCRREDELYIIEWEIESSESETDMDGDTLEMFGGYALFELELPHAAIAENATSKEGNKYSWSLLNMKESLYVSFTLDGSVPQGIVIDPTTPSSIDPAGDTTVPATESTTDETTVETTEVTREMTTEATVETTTQTSTITSEETKPDEVEEPSETTKKNKESKSSTKSKEKSESPKTFPLGALLGILGGIILVAGVVILIVTLKGKKN